MLTHNLKIAIRNLLKYKLQTTISVLSIAIGIVVLSAVHSYVQRHIQEPIMTGLPYYDRMCTITLDSIHKSNPDSYYLLCFKRDILNAINNGGGLQTIEGEPTFANNSFFNEEDISYSLGDTLVRKFRERTLPILPSYPNYIGYRSAITGERIKVLKPGEAIISETNAHRIFGDINPVGAIFTARLNYSHFTYHPTIVDVYQDIGNTETIPHPNAVLYAIDDNILMEIIGSNDYINTAMNVLLKEGCTPQQLQQEIDAYLEPFGLKSTVYLDKERYADYITSLRTSKALAYLLGSLILLVASIGFLRMQMQLFNMRKRELSLRIVNGAKRHELFVLLMTEVALVIIAAVVVALMFGSWLEQSINALHLSMDDSNGVLPLGNLFLNSTIIGGVLLILCGIIVWFTLTKICRNEQGLAANMRGARNHTFRNAMLWLQVSVGMLFVCAALVVAVMCNTLSQFVKLPEDETPYCESILINSSYAENVDRLREELSALPDVAQTIHAGVNNGNYVYYNQIDRNEFLEERIINFMDVLITSYIRDAAWLDFYNVEVNWARPELKDEPCVLIREDFYPMLDSAGVLNNGVLTMRYEDNAPLPIAGTFKKLIFSEDRKYTRNIEVIAINPMMSYIYDQYILVPRKGRYGELWNAVQSTIARVEPTVVQPMAFNLYEAKAPKMKILKHLRQGGWVLGCVALIVCIMGIYSTVALDTRARRKEVAIRKINGAKPKDIALMFARLYIIIITLAFAALLPVSLMARSYFKEAWILEHYLEPPVLPLYVAGCFIVAVVIAIIVAWQVRGIMKVNPSEMIAKE